MKQYLVVFERAGENYSAYAPDLPGCVSTGKTVEETEANMKEAISLYIATLHGEGKPVPEPATLAKSVIIAD